MQRGSAVFIDPVVAACVVRSVLTSPVAELPRAAAPLCQSAELHSAHTDRSVDEHEKRTHDS